VAPPDLRIAPDAPGLQKVVIVGLPNLPVTDAFGAGDLPIETRKFFDDLVAQRIPKELSRPDILDEEMLSRLAKTSGGIIRDFVRMVYEASSLAARNVASRLDRRCIDYGIQKLAEEYGDRAAVADVREMLRQVAKSHALPGGPDALNLIHHNLVLRYHLKGRTWYDVHPVVRESLPA